MRHKVKRRIVAGVLLAVALGPTAAAGGLQLVAVRAAEAVATTRAARDLAAQQLADRQAEAAAPPAPAAADGFRLHADADVTQALQRLQQLADEHGAEVTTLAVGDAVDPARHVLHLAGQAAPAALCALLAAIEREPNLLVVDGGSVAAAEETTVAFDLTVSAWHGGDGR